jgi:hypothetical protein
LLLGELSRDAAAIAGGGFFPILRKLALLLNDPLHRGFLAHESLESPWAIWHSSGRLQAIDGAIPRSPAAEMDHSSLIV